ncbi:AAA-like domain protein [Symmachiella dynata]|uniref:ATP-binding protein n=1 Tax=Symmachiella dynata TaxID=2527995 RepID=UPI001189D27F|nr:DUF87 domain-containing protein [Symmachiella dynata]QDT49476.1 AAA-like domain protein [Symmachiella dynata]
MMPFAVSQELKVGAVVEVAGDSIRIEIDSLVSDLTRTHGGDVYPVGQCGSVLKLHSGRRVLFAYVTVLRMRSEIAFQEGVPLPPPSEDARMIEATLFAEGQWSESSQTLRLDRGVRTYPLPGQFAYLTTLQELSALYGPKEVNNSKQYSINIGSYVGANNSACFADLDRLVGLHSAVLGSTGAGKSGAVAAILRSILELELEVPASDPDGLKVNSPFRPRVVLIDPHGEYRRAFSDRCVVFQAYSAASLEDSDSSMIGLRLPYWLMSGEEFRDLVIGKTEWEATSENNIVLKALRHSRLVAKGLIEPARNDWKGQRLDGTLSPPDDRPTKPDDQDAQDQIASYDRDTPDIFSLKEFRTYIEFELGMREKSGKWDPLSPSEFKSHASILDKLAVLERDPRLRFMMQEYKTDDPSLADIIHQFVGNTASSTKTTINADIRIIDISGLPNEVAGPLTAAIARLLFQYKVWQTRDERERDPVMLVCEEAHRYVPDTGLAEYASAQKAIRRLAKEGRKYGIGMMLVSQRPADVEGTVLSQCNSWIVLRLTNSVDQQHVRRFLPDNLAGLASLLPSLTRQEAIFVGDAAPLPARIRIRTLADDQLPRSDDISYGDGWAQGPVDKEFIEKVVARWQRKVDSPNSESESSAANQKTMKPAKKK